jgi:hypothetical protein|tara:strand:+ start:181 stop:384 length:204 start_codon:yes stop_codon:yes gene_type:complete
MRRHRIIQSVIIAAAAIVVAAVAWPTDAPSSRPESTYSQRQVLPTTAVAITGLLVLLAFSRSQSRRA